jgi:hypothetical protein
MTAQPKTKVKEISAEEKIRKAIMKI